MCVGGFLTVRVVCVDFFRGRSDGCCLLRFVVVGFIDMLDMCEQLISWQISSVVCVE